MRDNRIDILRFIGLAMIILAHVEPPSFLMGLRNFDVPLMVLLSGMSFGLSYTTSKPYISYIWKRIKRLIFPVWIFLTIYFFALAILLPNSFELQSGVIFATYALMGGIGYVWIIRVFMLVAVASPLILKFHKTVTSNHLYFSIIAISFIISETIRYYSSPYIGETIGKYFSLSVSDIIPYSIIFALGLRIPTLAKNQLIRLLSLNLIIFIVFGLGLYIARGELIPTQSFKYPPSIYYLSYALFVSCLLWMYSENIYRLIELTRFKYTIYFIAQNSIWIYLWHIPFIKFIHTTYTLKYILVFSLAFIFTYAQIWTLNNFFIKRISNERVKNNLKVLFTG